MPATAEQIETDRLILRRWRESDREPMAAINTDPEVTRFLNRPTNPAGVAGFLERAETHWQEHGFGWYAAEGASEEDRGELLGFVGIALPTFIPELAERPELGWRLARAAWGKGYATEGARAVRDQAVAAGFGELISIIHPDNRRSQRVAEKLGMAVEGQASNPLSGQAVDVWRLQLRT